ncbi:hypothetical protein AAFF_G00061600 [Aldrovandia affinis]|uniref:Uncharacterized protein n=1 Tax=Aldrovandia affinis TaxID=143900 RepID=A0AAD7S042_9TELE|nr:hypothetical protein AAFF_G00061600 [Aldrovandia affinis]
MLRKPHIPTEKRLARPGRWGEGCVIPSRCTLVCLHCRAAHGGRCWGRFAPFDPQFGVQSPVAGDGTPGPLWSWKNTVHGSARVDNGGRNLNDVIKAEL